jgi:hypothetical protein
LSPSRKSAPFPPESVSLPQLPDDDIVAVVPLTWSFSLP